LLSVIRSALKEILPFNGQELEFIERIRGQGDIQPNLITADEKLQGSILVHPAIKWAATRSRAR
jgi:hypothetical protein